MTRYKDERYIRILIFEKCFKEFTNKKTPGAILQLIFCDLYYYILTQIILRKKRINSFGVFSS